MKTLILDGSPHKNGNTAFLLEKWQTLAPSECKVIHAYDSAVLLCDDCRGCFSHVGCAKKDAMAEIYSYVQECDRIILASSVYFSQLTGPLLSLCSRFQAVWAARKFMGQMQKRKQGLVFLTGGGEGDYRPALSGAKAILACLNADFCGSVLSLKTDDISACRDDTILTQMHQCKNRLGENIF